jgi:hypothetical protein
MKFLGVLILTGICCAAQAQDTRYFDLKAFPDPQRLVHYQIVDIVDQRTDTSSLGALQLGFITRKRYLVDLQKGLTATLKTFIAHNFKQDTSTIPVSVHILTLRVREVAPGVRPEIEVQLRAAFFIGDQKMTEYTVRATVKTMGDQLKQVSDLVGQNLLNSLLAFDEWWSKNQNVYAPNAPVTVEVIMNTTTDTARLVNYSRKRLLTIADFQADPDPREKAVAITASSITVKYGMITDSDQLKMLVVITPYFDRQRSWFRSTAFDATVLAHEQGHFTITAIKACALADTLRGLVFTKTNCYAMVDRIQLKIKQDLKELQDLYDNKTGHGIVPSVQDKWSLLLKELLDKQSCYP